VLREEHANLLRAGVLPEEPDVLWRLDLLPVQQVLPRPDLL
jgi:hypothetical protein